MQREAGKKKGDMFKEGRQAVVIVWFENTENWKWCGEESHRVEAEDDVWLFLSSTAWCGLKNKA